MALIDLSIPAGVYRNGTDLQGESRWRDANLVRWHDGVMRPVGGWRTRSADAANAPLRGMLTWVDNINSPYAASGTLNKLFAWNAGGVIQDITPSNLTAGRIDAAAFTGFGGGFFGLSTFGTTRPITSSIQPATSWQLQPWGEYLVALSNEDGKIYEWDLDTVDGAELVATPDFATDTNWTKGVNWAITGGVAAYQQLIKLFDADDAVIADPATDTITITAHGFSDGDEVTYTVPAAPASALGGLTGGTNYFVVGSTTNTIQLAATSGGAAINLTANNSLTIDGDDAAVVDTAADKIVEANTFSNGDYVTYDNGGGVDIGGLTSGANYYIVGATSSEFQLSLTSGGAAIDLTDNNSVTVDATDATVVDVTTDVITIANTFTDGEIVTYDNGGGTDIVGLVSGTDYYIISASATDFQVSLTSGGAAVDLTALGTGTAHVFRQDIGSTHDFRVDVGAGHELARVNFGNLEQTVDGLNNANYFDGSNASVVDVANDKIIIANTLTSGDYVTYNNGGGTDIAGLTDGSSYYVVNATGTEFQVSLTSGGPAINLTAVGTGTSHDFRNASTGRDDHAIIVTLIDPNDDSDATTVPSASVKITETATSTVLVDEELSVGANRFHFDTFEDEVKIEIIPAAYDTPNFDIDDVSLKNVPTADLIETAPINNLGIVVTEERFLFALGAGGNPRLVQWSDRENNKLWTPATENEAGDLELNTSGQLMAGCNVQGQTLLLTTRDAHVANYIGPPYVYGIERVGSSCGLAAPQAFSVVDAGCFWMGVNSFYAYTGGKVQELPSDVSDYVFNDINRAQVSKTFAMSNSMFGEIWWFYPSSSSIENDRYVVYNYTENTWYIGEMSRTAGSDRGAFPLPQMADPSDYKLYEHETGTFYDGSKPFAETGPIRIGSGDQIMKVTSMIPDEKTQGDVTATFKTRFYSNGPERSYGPYDMSNPTSIRFSGRQIRMRVDGDELADWRVGINRIDVVAGGRR